MLVSLSLGAQAQTQPQDTTMGDETHINHSKNQSIGKLQKIGTSHIYTLSLGINTIGRKAQTSNATVPVSYTHLDVYKRQQSTLQYMRHQL